MHPGILLEARLDNQDIEIKRQLSRFCCYGMVERLQERGPGPWSFLSHGPFDFAILLEIVNRARSWDLRLR